MQEINSSTARTGRLFPGGKYSKGIPFVTGITPFATMTTNNQKRVIAKIFKQYNIPAVLFGRLIFSLGFFYPVLSRRANIPSSFQNAVKTKHLNFVLQAQTDFSSGW